MNSEITNVSLKFQCPANWEEMTTIAGGRFCDHCAKVVHDFTDAKQAEFQKILIENSNSVCGRFRPEQMAPQDTLLPRWKRWLSAAMLLIGVNFFTRCSDPVKGKVVVQSNQQNAANQLLGVPLMPEADTNLKPPIKKSLKKKQINFAEPVMLMGDVAVPEPAVATDSLDISMCFIEPMPEFPGGQEQMAKFLVNNLNFPNNLTEPMPKILVAFTVEPDGSLTDINFVKLISKPLADEVIRVINLMPKWKATMINGKPVKTIYTLPITVTPAVN